MAARLAELDGVDLPSEDDDALAERVEDLLADLVEPSRATALEKLGEGERGIQIATGWLRRKVARSAP